MTFSVSAPTNNTGALLNNGTEVLSIDSSNNVIIPNDLTLSSASPYLNLTDTDTGANAQLNAASGVGNLSIEVDQNAIGSDPNFIVKVAGTEKFRINSDGYVNINGIWIGGIAVTIADDAVGTVTTPRQGGFMFITQYDTGNPQYPNHDNVSMLYYDTGPSNMMARLDASVWTGTVSGQGAEIDLTTGTITGTSGTDGRTLISSVGSNNQLQINNRQGTSKTYEITFL